MKKLRSYGAFLNYVKLNLFMRGNQAVSVESFSG